MNLSTWLVIGLGLLAGVLLGVGMLAWWLHKKSTEELPLPDKWPLLARGIITTEEYEVLNWLRLTFNDHLVMVKLPVLRFTIPVNRAKNGGGHQWQKLLNGVYCTFTVCTPSGSVVGCVDVPPKRGLPKGNRELKESLLSDCGIAYTVVRPSSLPKSNAMRAAFLGEMDVVDQPDHQDTRGGDSSFHADLDAFTQQAKRAAKDAALKELNKNNEFKQTQKNQPAGFNPDGTGAFHSRKAERFPTQWEDSFTQPSDSQTAKLDRN
ncbi:MAG: DUF2726 domain-containing protein [Polaromonas sp.]|nr:DUF2726 domain-containing protein [Polaromonas sp.]